MMMVSSCQSHALRSIRVVRPSAASRPLVWGEVGLGVGVDESGLVVLAAVEDSEDLDCLGVLVEVKAMIALFL